MRDIVRCSLAHLLPIMGKRLLVDIEARDVAKYQSGRLAEGASSRTVILARVVGWSASTMAKMAARYGHFGIEELRSAVQSISTAQPKNAAPYPQNPPQSTVQTMASIN